MKKLPEWRVPAPLGGLLQRLPMAPPSALLVAALNQLLRRGVLPADMALLAGRRFEVRVEDAGLQLRFAAQATHFVTDRGTGEPDLCLQAGLLDFGRLMLREEDPDTLFFQRRLRIDGDTELGLIVKNLLDSVDWSRTPLRALMHG